MISDAKNLTDRLEDIIAQCTGAWLLADDPVVLAISRDRTGR